MVVADSLWSIGTTADPSDYSGGAHGYDNAFTDMNTIFYAEGPTDGNLENVRHIFRSE